MTNQHQSFRIPTATATYRYPRQTQRIWSKNILVIASKLRWGTHSCLNAYILAPPKLYRPNQYSYLSDSFCVVLVKIISSHYRLNEAAREESLGQKPITCIHPAVFRIILRQFGINFSRLSFGALGIFKATLKNLNQIIWSKTRAVTTHRLI